MKNAGTKKMAPAFFISKWHPHFSQSGTRKSGTRIFKKVAPAKVATAKVASAFLKSLFTHWKKLQTRFWIPMKEYTHFLEMRVSHVCTTCKMWVSSHFLNWHPQKWLPQRWHFAWCVLIFRTVCTIVIIWKTLDTVFQLGNISQMLQVLNSSYGMTCDECIFGRRFWFETEVFHV